MTIIKLAKHVNFDALMRLVPNLKKLRSNTYLTTVANNDLDIQLGLVVTNHWLFESYLKLVQHHTYDFESDCSYWLTVDWLKRTVTIHRHCVDSSDYFYGPTRSSIERARSDRLLSQILQYHLQHGGPLVDPTLSKPGRISGNLQDWISRILPDHDDDGLEEDADFAA